LGALGATAPSYMQQIRRPHHSSDRHPHWRTALPMWLHNGIRASQVPQAEDAVAGGKGKDFSMLSAGFMDVPDQVARIGGQGTFWLCARAAHSGTWASILRCLGTRQTRTAAVGWKCKEQGRILIC